MDNLILKSCKIKNTNYAIFDFDWTLVKPKDNRKFPTNIEDWKYLRNSVKHTLQKYKLTHHIVIVTNQTKLWKVDQIKLVIEDLELTNDSTIIIGFTTRKPDTSLFLKAFPNFLENNNENTFFVGDAAGRVGDFSDSDKQFATNLKIKFMLPEEIFPLDTIESNININIPQEKEVIIMIGYPGSGKTTICKDIFEKHNYHIVSGDILKTSSKMIKDAIKHINNSIVFDSTAGTKEKRQEFIQFAKKYNLPVRAIWIQTPMDISMERNKQRALITGSKIPDVVYYVYRKNFEEPIEEEGFSLVKV
jgi:bifunctional polynucleotide phosphatase/kinase